MGFIETWKAKKKFYDEQYAKAKEEAEKAKVDRERQAIIQKAKMDADRDVNEGMLGKIKRIIPKQKKSWWEYDNDNKNK